MESDEHRPLKKRVVARQEQQQAPRRQPPPLPRQPPPRQPPPRREEDDANTEEPPPRQPAPRQPAPRQPDPRQPAPRQPDPRQPAPRQPAPRQPAPRQPAPRQPDPRQPPPRQPDPRQPAPRQPPPRQPAPRQPPPRQPDPPQEEDESNTEEPPHLPCRYQSLWNYFETCALLGCYLRVKGNHSHCCYGHFHLAQEFGRQAVAFHYFDGFKDIEHRKRVCILTLLNRVRGLETGVPNLDQVDGIFTTLPWHLEILPENAGNWLFFKTPPLLYRSMHCNSNRAISWKKNPRRSIGFDVLQHPPVTYQLFHMDGGDDHHAQLAEEWRLHLFQCRDISLYCLSNGISLLVKPLPKLKQGSTKDKDSSKDKDDPSSKKDSSKHHRPSTSNSSSVPQQGRLSVLAVTEGVACRDGETVELQQIKAKKKIGPFALKKLAKSLFKVCEVHPQDVVFN